MELTPLHERILAVIGHQTFRSVAQLTDQNPETVRRYLNGASPSIEFVAALCARLDLNAHWMLTGQGVPHNRDTRSHVLKEANPSELLAAVATALEALADRVDRLDTMVNTIDVRLNARAADARTDGAVISAAAATPRAASDVDHSTAKPGTVHGKPDAVADAVTKRPRPPAG